MGYILRLCFTAYFVYGLMLGQANALGVNTGKTTTMGSMRGGTLGAASNISYQTGRHGLQTYYTQNLQSYGGKMYQLPTRAKTPTSGLIKGLRNLLKSPAGKTHIGLIVGAWALDGILKEAGVFKEDDDYYIIDLNHELEIEGQWNTHPQGFGKSYPSVKSYISDITHCNDDYYKPCTSTLSDNNKEIYVRGRSQRGFWKLYHVGKCPVDAILTGQGCISAQKRPLTDDDIDIFDFNNWTPPVNVPKTAVEQVYPYISPADTTIELDPIIVTAPAETVTAPDGSVKQTTTTETVSVSNPNADPALQVSVKTTTETYQDGILTDTQTTTTTTDATAASPNHTQQQQITDCDLVPTLCATQKEQLERDKARDEWLKELPPDEPDLSQLAPKEIDIKREFTIDFGSKTCSSSVPIHLSSIGIGSKFDFTLVCDFAVKLRLILLSIAYLVAARILVGALK